VESSRPAPPMSGDLNIAVARFSAVSAQREPAAQVTARALADSVFRHLGPELTSLEDVGYEIQTRSPRDTGAADAQQAEQRTLQLEALAEAAHADIIITANLVSGDGQTRFTPELYIADRKLGSAHELGGYYGLGQVIVPGDPDSNPAVRLTLRDGLLTRARGIARFILGLGFYQVGDFPKAAREFTRTQQDWADPVGRKLLNLFLGNTAGKRAQFGLARTYYQQALDTDRSYGRARLGLAELTYQAAAGKDCQPGQANADGLRTALTLFQHVLDAGDQSPATDLPTKVAFGLGRTYWCLTEGRIADYSAEARAQFITVIDAFDRGNRRIRELAAQASFGLGLTYLSGQASPDAEDYRRAIEAHQRAIRYSLDPRQQADVLESLADIYEQLNNTQQACEAYRRAAALDPARAARVLGGDASFPDARECLACRHDASNRQVRRNVNSFSRHWTSNVGKVRTA
jgi:tetratricopeptide (TPR) repeat protein